MADQNKLLDILYRMQSDYIPEHTAAAHDFMNEGFPTDLLLSLIEKTQQPNLVSMFFYISGQRSDSETLKAWDYLRRRVEMEPQKFEATNDSNPTFNPDKLEGTYRQLLFAARKYLITKNKFSVFLLYLKRIQLEASSIVKQAFSQLDVNLDRDSTIFGNEYLIYHIRYEVHRVVESFEVKPTKRNFSSSELNVVRFVSTLDPTCCRILGRKYIPILLYRQWLVIFFLQKPPEGLQLKSLFPPIINKESLIPFVGFDLGRLTFLYDEITGAHATTPTPTRRTVSVDDLKSAFQKMKDMVLNFSFLEYITNAEKISLFKKGDLKYYNRFYFPDIPCPYYETIRKLIKTEQGANIGNGFLIRSISDILYIRPDISLCLEILNRAENIALLWIEKNIPAYECAVISTNFYFYFQQTIFNFGYSDNFCKGIYSLGKSTMFYEALLLPYLVEESFFDINSRCEAQSYMALDVLFSAKSVVAYQFVCNLLRSSKSFILKPPSENYWVFNLNQFYRDVGGSDYSRYMAFEVGYDWEKLCQKIHIRYCDNVNINDGGTTLENRAEPDITVGIPKRNKKGKIIHVNRIIECKKSSYFAESSDLANNETTYKYISYCDIMEYWILEKPHNFKAPNLPNIKYVFAGDLLNAPWLSDDLKEETKKILSKSENLDKMRPKKLQTVEGLLSAIDYILKTPLPPSKEKIQKAKHMPSTVIRQYALNGTFIKEFKTPHDAAEATGIKSDAITTVTSGRRNSAGGFLWKKCEADSPQENIDPPNTSLDLKGKVILQIDQTGEVVSTYNANQELKSKETRAAARRPKR